MCYLPARSHFRLERLPGLRFLCYLSSICRDGCAGARAYPFPPAPSAYIPPAHIMVRPV